MPYVGFALLVAYSVSDAMGQVTQPCPRIFHVHRVDRTNIGDMMASPLQYFADLRTATTAVIDSV